jgi:acyl-CoA synthetase (AMP-forming)/AMP-acid ligase II
MATAQAAILNLDQNILPNIVDRLAEVAPERVYAEFPKCPSSYDEGFRQITYADFANAINGLAWELETRLGKREGYPVITYIGPNDLRYTALALACCKVGYLVGYSLESSLHLTCIALSDIPTKQYTCSWRAVQKIGM